MRAQLASSFSLIPQQVLEPEWFKVISPSGKGTGFKKPCVTCTPKFIAALCTIARTWKQPRCPSADEWIRKLWYTHSGILLSYKKGGIWVSSNEVDEPRAYYTEWSKSERERQILSINAYMWNLEGWYWQSYMQGRKGDTDIRNRLLDSVGESEGGMIWENSTETHTFPYVR